MLYFRAAIDHRQQRDRRLRGFLREVLARSTFDYYPVYDPWVVDRWAGLPSDSIFDDESEQEQGDVDPTNDTFFALTQLVCLQHFLC